MLEIDIKLLPFQGVTNERALTQGVASLALGYVHHWAFSPSLLNLKLKQYLSFSGQRSSLRIYACGQVFVYHEKAIAVAIEHF